MCFEFSSCLGGGIKDDYGGERSNHGGCGGRRHGRKGNRGAADHKPATAYVLQPAVDEAGRKTYHDGTWKEDHAGGGGDGYYAAYAQEKAHETPKLPAWHNKVGDNAGYAHNTVRLHQTAADHREHAAMDYHHYSSAATTLVRY